MLAGTVPTPDTAGVLTAGQIRAARAYLGWTREELAAKVELSAQALKLIETEKTTDPRSSTLRRLQAVFEAEGIVVVDEGKPAPTGGPGLRFPA